MAHPKYSGDFIARRENASEAERAEVGSTKSR